MTIALLILHGLVAVALLGAITHQLVGLLRTPGAPGPASPRGSGGGGFLRRYLSVGQWGFSTAIVVLFALSVVLGALIYPAYRIEVRIPFEEMGLRWAVGLFEVKEHWGGLGLGILPLYAYVWRGDRAQLHGLDRLTMTALLALIVWSDFLAGHLLNNIRGLP